jgi:hypothetical protein
VVSNAVGIALTPDPGSLKLPQTEGLFSMITN